jgi:hypothetical protein
MPCHAPSRIYSSRSTDRLTSCTLHYIHDVSMHTRAREHPIDLIASLHASSHALVEIATSDVMSVRSSRSCANRAESSDKNALDASTIQIAIGALSTRHVPRYLACTW